MGTSSDFDGGKGGAWTPYKHAASNFAKRGGKQRAERVLARHVATLGGAGGATRSASSGVRAGQALAFFVSGLADGGLSAVLRGFGLGDLVGKDRFEVIEGLLEAIAGAGADLEQQVARTAACDVLDELYPAEIGGYEELEAIALGPNDVARVLESFIAAYIFNRLLPTLAQKFANLDDQEIARHHEAELRDYVPALVRLRLDSSNPLEVDWRGTEARVLIQAMLSEAYEVLEGLE